MEIGGLRAEVHFEHTTNDVSCAEPDEETDCSFSGLSTGQNLPVSGTPWELLVQMDF
jgi:hypothetical protein